MSKAKEKAMQYCCTKCTNNKLNCGMKLISHGRNCIEFSNYIAGYHQAEKDLELTWEDIVHIIETYNELEFSREFATVTFNDTCKEVLKRFKTQKEELC